MNSSNLSKSKFTSHHSAQPRGAEEYIRQQSGFVQGYSYAPSLQSVGGNSTHDMNKQVQTAPTGPYASLSPGTMPGAAPHHQPGLSGPVPSQSTSMVPIQGQQLNTRPPMTNLSNIYSRQAPSRQIHNMSRPPLSGVVNQPTPQTSQQYGAHMSMFPSQFHIPHQTSMVMPSTAPVQLNFPAQRQQFGAQQQYSLQTPQVYIPGASWNSPFNSVYYSQLPSVTPCAPVSHMQPVQPAPARKTESKAIAIINPETGKNILDEMDNTVPSRIKENNQPDENDSQNVSTIFAAQVAATLAPDNEKNIATKAASADERATNQQSTDALSEVMLSDAFLNTVESKPTELDDSERYNDDPLVYSGNTTQFYNKELDVSVLGAKSLENQSVNSLETDNSVQTNEVSKSTDFVYCAKENKNYCAEINKIESISVQEPVQISVDDKDMQSSSDVVDGEVVIVEEPSSVAVQSIVTDNLNMNSAEDSVIKPITQVQNQQSSHKLKNPQNEEAKDSPVTVSAVCKEEKLTADVGKKSKKKKIELNKKGESKEGGDMDAFLDKNEDVSLVTSVLVNQLQGSPSAEGTIDGLLLEENTATNCDAEEEIVTKEQNDLRHQVSENESILLLDVPNNVANEEAALDEQTKNHITLKYNYKEDQWSPLNPEGKKQYDREFLLNMQSQPMSMQKPLNLPNLDVIKDKAIIHRLSESGRGVPPVPTAAARQYTDLFLPPYTRANPTRPPHPSASRRSQQGRNKPPRVITLTSSLNQAVKLHEADNAWKPTHKAETDPDDYKTQLLFKKVRGILNKLTPQKFNTLVGQVKQLEITTEESLNGVIDLVFEKALDEPNFSVPYANMCKQLALIKVPSSGQEGQFVNFRKLLLTKCQKEFEKDRSDKLKRDERMKLINESEANEKKKQLMEEFEDEERRNRRRQLGNIRFIGELFKLGMLIEPIMHQCIKTLLSQGDEDSIECLCRLLQTIGKELDQCKKTPSDTVVLESYFADIRKIIESKLISSRVRFMLQDVMDLRQKNWIPRRDENLPKTIDQIHQEAEREAQEQQERLQQMPYTKRIPDDRDRRNKTRTPNPNYDDGWITSSKSSKGNYSVDPSKLKLTKPTEVENIQLGPGNRGFSSWGRGSSGGTKANADQESKSAVHTNRYSALAEQPPVPMYEARRGSQRSAASSRESSRGPSNQLPQSSVRKTPSTSKERESLLETVKDLTRIGANAGKSVEIKKAPESENVNGKPITDNVLKGPDITSEEEMGKKTRPLIDEFIHNQDLAEAIRCVTELTSSASVHMFITAAINQVLERSSQSRSNLGQLFYTLLWKEVITLEQYNRGLKDVLELVDDYALDIPKIWDYLAEILVPVIEENIIPFSSIKVTLQPCIPSNTAGKLVSAILHCAAKKRGTIKVGEMWRESGLKWENFIESDVETFLQSNKLEFTENEAQSMLQPKVPLTFDDIKRKLTFYIEKPGGDNEEIFDWIECYVGKSGTTQSAFLRALVTSVLENAITGSGAQCELDITKVKIRMPILQRYLDHNDHLELQALYAMQSLMNKLDHPKGMLKQIFDALYDDDLISEDAFKQWEESQDPAEQEGKGVAIHGVASFLLWLKEAEDESEVE